MPAHIHVEVLRTSERLPGISDAYCPHWIFFSSSVSVDQSLVERRWAQISSPEFVAVQCLPCPPHPSRPLPALFWCPWAPWDKGSCQPDIASDLPLMLFYPHRRRQTFPESETLLSEDEWKVLVLKGNAGTRANVTLWVYGDEGVTGPISLSKDSPEQLFLPRQEDEFQVNSLRRNVVFWPFQRYLFYNTGGCDCACMCVLCKINLWSIRILTSYPNVCCNHQRKYFSLAYLIRTRKVYF